MSKASNEPVLLRRDEGRVAILTLNRPHAMNALSGELIDALQAEFDRLAGDREIRCVVIEATGRAFSTGHDLKEVTSTRDYAFHHDLLTRCSAMMMSIKRLLQPHLHVRVEHRLARRDLLRRLAGDVPGKGDGLGV
jgi:enoyl-CoA hydratase/carnithine racemase